MTANKKASSPQRPRWTLKQARNRPSVLRHSPMDVDAWNSLRRWIWPVALSGWLVALALTFAAAYLALWQSPKPVTFVQEEHGMVLMLPTAPLQGGLDGH